MIDLKTDNQSSTIVIIGCGNLGKRHLESLTKSQNPLDIYLVDNSDLALKKCLDEFKDVSNKHINIITSDIENLPKKIDLGIISTTSDSRRKVLIDLIPSRDLNYLILEKFLFNEVSHYHEIDEMLSENSIKTWVNQWMSHEKSFLEVAKLFNPDERINMKVHGSNWRMCCNSVHFVNYFDMITNRNNLNLFSSSYDPIITETKRSGFLELTGAIEISTTKGDKLFLESSPCENLEVSYPIYMDISTDSIEVNCSYRADSLKIRLNDNKNIITKDLKVKFQSSMTLDVVNTILKSGNCSLPDYRTSKEHHLLLFESFSKEFSKHSNIFAKELPVT